jgi:hypothetical protein
MRGAEAFALDEGRGIGTPPCNLVGDRLVIGTDHDGERGARAFRGGIQHMRQQRLAGHRVQHFRQRGPHPRPLAGREHHRQAGSSSHEKSSTRAFSSEVASGSREENASKQKSLSGPKATAPSLGVFAVSGNPIRRPAKFRIQDHGRIPVNV